MIRTILLTVIGLYWAGVAMMIVGGLLFARDGIARRAADQRITFAASLLLGALLWPFIKPGRSRHDA